MTKLRSVAALLAISAVASCATAINDGTVPGPPTAGAGAGSDSGGSPGEEGGGPTGGTAEQAGQPGSAGKGVAGSTTSSGGKGGSGSGGSGSGSAGKASSGGSVGVAGAAGSHAGGSAGTSSSAGAGGSSAGSPGSGGGTTTGPCNNPIELPATAMGAPNFDTLDAVCFRTKAVFNHVSCSGFEGRTLKVNDVLLGKCDGLMTITTPMIDGWNYLDASAGTNKYANMSWWKT